MEKSDVMASLFGCVVLSLIFFASLNEKVEPEWNENIVRAFMVNGKCHVEGFVENEQINFTVDVVNDTCYVPTERIMPKGWVTNYTVEFHNDSTFTYNSRRVNYGN